MQYHFKSHFSRMELFTFILALFGLSASQEGCDLVPGNSGQSCMDLETTPLIRTDESRFGPLIEGASTDKNGQIFAVNFGDASTTNTLGQVYPTQRLFFRDANVTTSWFNGIRFLDENTAFAADVVNHRVLKLTVQVDLEGNSIVTRNEVYCQNSTMLQPNDLTLSKTGTVFTSGMRWLGDTDDTHGDIWSCTPDGKVQLLEIMGRTNGIDLSPDEETLYVSESYNRGGSAYVQKIWKYSVDVLQGTIANKELFADFADIDGTVSVDIDGMKTDVNGNLFVTRHGGRQVVIFGQEGTLIGKIALSFPNPTNIEFGGVNGTTLFVVGKCDGADAGCVDTIDVINPGRSWSILQ